MSALKARWAEEAGVVIAEMERTVRFYKFMEDHWLQMSERLDKEETSDFAAYARK